MKLRGHAKLLGIVTAVWLTFWVGGLPDYYRQYSSLFMIVFDGVVFVALAWVVHWVVSKTPSRFRLSLSLWLAFYISVPLLIYDYLYCGLYLGHGWTFLWSYWYLTVYYVIPWLLCPGIAWWIDRSAPQRA